MDFQWLKGLLLIFLSPLCPYSHSGDLRFRNATARNRSQANSGLDSKRQRQSSVLLCSKRSHSPTTDDKPFQAASSQLKHCAKLRPSSCRPSTRDGCPLSCGLRRSKASSANSIWPTWRQSIASYRLSRSSAKLAAPAPPAPPQ